MSPFNNNNNNNNNNNSSNNNNNNDNDNNNILSRVFAVQADNKVKAKVKEREKAGQITGPCLKKQWNMKVTVIQIVFYALRSS